MTVQSSLQSGRDYVLKARVALPWGARLQSSETCPRRLGLSLGGGNRDAWVINGGSRFPRDGGAPYATQAAALGHALSCP